MDYVTDLDLPIPLSRATSRSLYRRWFSNARGSIRRARREGGVTIDGWLYPSELMAMYTDTGVYRDVSAVADLVRTGRNGGAFVGTAFRASVRRDIPGRYPRLNIP